MVARIQITNINQVIAGLKATDDAIEDAVKYAVGMAGLAVERQAKQNASTGVHARGEGHIQGTGPGPNVVTGNLRRSIKTEAKIGFGSSYIAEVSASAIYAYAVEKGLPEWGGVKYPYLEPAATTLRDNGTLSRVFITNFATRLRGING